MSLLRPAVAHCLAGVRPQPFISDQAMGLSLFRAIVLARDRIDRSTWGDTPIYQSQDAPGWSGPSLTEPGPRFDDVPPLFLEALAWHNVRLMHAHHGMFALEFLSLRACSSLPLVISLYGFDISGFPRSSHENSQRLRMLFAQASLVLAMSKDMRADAIAWGCDPSRIVIHHPAVALDRFQYRGERAPNGRIEILCVSDFTPKKGVDRLVEAFARVRRAIPEVRLHLAGAPITTARESYRQLQLRIEALALSDAVCMCGWQPYASLPSIYVAADIFVLASEQAPDGSKEGVPAVILEAMATGLPVVSTRHAGIPHAVVDGETGLLVDEKDTNGLESALISLAGSADRRNAMGLAGRRRVEWCFDLRAQRRRLEVLYQQLVAGNPIQTNVE